MLRPRLLLQATQKQFRMWSVQPGIRGNNDLGVGRKTATFPLFFFSQVGLRTYQNPCIKIMVTAVVVTIAEKVIHCCSHLKKATDDQLSTTFPAF
jgi:hypothetical protein